MATTVQFVDSIASSPTVRLDLNASPWQVSLDNFDLSPPPLRRAVAATLLTDGSTIPASAYDNRLLRMHLELVHTSADNAATEMQKLARELNRATNFLKYQPGTTAPVFFRTFRSPEFRWTVVTDSTAPYMFADVEIVAEPFAYGLLETPVSAVTVQTDPASGSGNACFVDVTGVDGDVETPAIIRWPASAIAFDRETLFAVRRRGTPSSAPFLFQAEAMTQGTNTTTQVNDANFSGSSNNYSRCTFGTATMQTRLSLTDLGTAGVNLRGRYRVLLRYRKNTSGDGINLQLRWGDQDVWLTVDNDAFATPAVTHTTTADLGDIQIPVGDDPVTDSTGVELAVSDSYFLALRAERTSGSGTIDFDFLALVPADDAVAIMKWNDDSSSPTDHWILDAAGPSASARDASSQVISSGTPAITGGGLPMLTPNQTNRIYMLRTVWTGESWTLTTVSPVSVSYHPRYLSVRPAST